MKLNKLFKTAAFAAATALSLPQAVAAWTPEEPIVLRIGFGAGGETDTMGRVLAATIERQTGWDVVVENRPGGGGVAMLSALVNEAADGLVLGMAVNIPPLMALSQRPDSVPFTLDSFDYIGTVTVAETALIAGSHATFSSIEELVEFARTEGSAKIAWDAPDAKAILQKIGQQEGVSFRMVKAESGAEMNKLLLGGQVDAAFGTGAHLPFIEDGQVKTIASLSDKRLSSAPDVPTLIESGHDFFIAPYFYITAPGGLPTDVKTALAAAMDQAVGDEALQTVVQNAVSAPAVNLGPDGTRQMMQESLGPIGALFAQ
ncbi:tripartite tricarboxylate transporter substrate binding protein [Phaeobacter italicus]|uniref:tripartite tricarboxylate transporter substrate binding protein n=1 Tax=Phaeobacter italicus TaxID=481446 RepID=UPI001CD7EC74|nr:tripartite tricarboxylate transporter substrate binding protein [Phaeobacter italicus]MCA0858866.1 tripartite tricarboxylate transporter substrate binding protein [Phaeobacter italicus]